MLQPKKNLKKLMMTCALLFSIITFANAQQAGKKQNFTPEGRAKELDEKVKLTDEQKTKAIVIYAEAQKKAREAVQKDKAVIMAKMQKFSDETDTKISALLTGDQKKIYKAWQDKLKAAREKEIKVMMGNQ